MKINEMYQKLDVAGATYPYKPELLLKAGMIPKAKMEHGRYYRGVCRGAYIALWDAGRQRFFYIGATCGTHVLEQIEHGEDFNGWDVFIPFEMIDPE